MTRIAGRPADPHAQVDVFVAALLAALEVPEVRAAIARILTPARSPSPRTSARGRR